MQSNQRTRNPYARPDDFWEDRGYLDSERYEDQEYRRSDHCSCENNHPKRFEDRDYARNRQYGHGKRGSPSPERNSRHMDYDCRGNSFFDTVAAFIKHQIQRTQISIETLEREGCGRPLHNSNDRLYRQDNDSPYRNDNNGPYHHDNDRPYHHVNDRTYHHDNDRTYHHDNDRPYHHDNDRPYHHDNDRPHHYDNDRPHHHDNDRPHHHDNDRPYHHDNDRPFHHDNDRAYHHDHDRQYHHDNDRQYHHDNNRPYHRGDDRPYHHDNDRHYGGGDDRYYCHGNRPHGRDQGRPCEERILHRDRFNDRSHGYDEGYHSHVGSGRGGAHHGDPRDYYRDRRPEWYERQNNVEFRGTDPSQQNVLDERFNDRFRQSGNEYSKRISPRKRRSPKRKRRIKSVDKSTPQKRQKDDQKSQVPPVQKPSSLLTREHLLARDVFSSESEKIASVEDRKTSPNDAKDLRNKVDGSLGSHGKSPVPAESLGVELRDLRYDINEARDVRSPSNDCHNGHLGQTTPTLNTLRRNESDDTMLVAGREQATMGVTSSSVVSQCTQTGLPTGVQAETSRRKVTVCTGDNPQQNLQSDDLRLIIMSRRLKTNNAVMETNEKHQSDSRDVASTPGIDRIKGGIERVVELSCSEKEKARRSRSMSPSKQPHRIVMKRQNKSKNEKDKLDGTGKNGSANILSNRNTSTPTQRIQESGPPAKRRKPDSSSQQSKDFVGDQVKCDEIKHGIIVISDDCSGEDDNSCNRKDPNIEGKENVTVPSDLVNRPQSDPKYNGSSKSIADHTSDHDTEGNTSSNTSKTSSSTSESTSSDTSNTSSSMSKSTSSDSKLSGDKDSSDLGLVPPGSNELESVAVYGVSAHCSPKSPRTENQYQFQSTPLRKCGNRHLVTAYLKDDKKFDGSIGSDSKHDLSNSFEIPYSLPIERESRSGHDDSIECKNVNDHVISENDDRISPRHYHASESDRLENVSALEGHIDSVTPDSDHVIINKSHDLSVRNDSSTSGYNPAVATSTTSTSSDNLEDCGARPEQNDSSFSEYDPAVATRTSSDSVEDIGIRPEKNDSSSSEYDPAIATSSDSVENVCNTPMEEDSCPVIATSKDSLEHCSENNASSSSEYDPAIATSSDSVENVANTPIEKDDYPFIATSRDSLEHCSEINASSSTEFNPSIVASSDSVEHCGVNSASFSSKFDPPFAASINSVEDCDARPEQNDNSSSEFDPAIATSSGSVEEVGDTAIATISVSIEDCSSPAKDLPIVIDSDSLDEEVVLLEHNGSTASEYDPAIATSSNSLDDEVAIPKQNDSTTSDGKVSSPKQNAITAITAICSLLDKVLESPQKNDNLSVEHESNNPASSMSPESDVDMSESNDSTPFEVLNAPDSSNVLDGNDIVLSEPSVEASPHTSPHTDPTIAVTNNSVDNKVNKSDDLVVIQNNSSITSETTLPVFHDRFSSEYDSAVATNSDSMEDAVDSGVSHNSVNTCTTSKLQFCDAVDKGISVNEQNGDSELSEAALMEHSDKTFFRSEVVIANDIDSQNVKPEFTGSANSELDLNVTSSSYLHCNTAISDHIDTSTSELDPVITTNSTIQGNGGTSEHNAKVTSELDQDVATGSMSSKDDALISNQNNRSTSEHNINIAASCNSPNGDTLISDSKAITTSELDHDVATSSYSEHNDMATFEHDINIATSCNSPNGDALISDRNTIITSKDDHDVATSTLASKSDELISKHNEMATSEHDICIATSCNSTNGDALISDHNAITTSELEHDGATSSLSSKDDALISKHNDMATSQHDINIATSCNTTNGDALISNHKSKIATEFDQDVATSSLSSTGDALISEHNDMATSEHDINIATSSNSPNGNAVTPDNIGMATFAHDTNISRSSNSTDSDKLMTEPNDMATVDHNINTTSCSSPNGEAEQSAFSEAHHSESIESALQNSNDGRTGFIHNEGIQSSDVKAILSKSHSEQAHPFMCANEDLPNTCVLEDGLNVLNDNRCGQPSIQESKTYCQRTGSHEYVLDRDSDSSNLSDIESDDGASFFSDLTSEEDFSEVDEYSDNTPGNDTLIPNQTVQVLPSDIFMNDTAPEKKGSESSSSPRVNTIENDDKDTFSSVTSPCDQDTSYSLVSNGSIVHCPSIESDCNGSVEEQQLYNDVKDTFSSVTSPCDIDRDTSLISNGSIVHCPLIESNCIESIEEQQLYNDVDIDMLTKVIEKAVLNGNLCSQSIGNEISDCQEMTRPTILAVFDENFLFDHPAKHNANVQMETHNTKDGRYHYDNDSFPEKQTTPPRPNIENVQKEHFTNCTQISSDQTSDNDHTLEACNDDNSSKSGISTLEGATSSDDHDSLLPCLRTGRESKPYNPDDVSPVIIITSGCSQSGNMSLGTPSTEETEDHIAQFTQPDEPMERYSPSLQCKSDISIDTQSSETIEHSIEDTNVAVLCSVDRCAVIKSNISDICLPYSPGSYSPIHINTSGNEADNEVSAGVSSPDLVKRITALPKTQNPKQTSLCSQKRDSFVKDSTKCIVDSLPEKTIKQRKKVLHKRRSSKSIDFSSSDSASCSIDRPSNDVYSPESFVPRGSSSSRRQVKPQRKSTKSFPHYDKKTTTEKESNCKRSSHCTKTLEQPKNSISKESVAASSVPIANVSPGKQNTPSKKNTMKGAKRFELHSETDNNQSNNCLNELKTVMSKIYSDKNDTNLKENYASSDPLVEEGRETLERVLEEKMSNDVLLDEGQELLEMALEESIKRSQQKTSIGSTSTENTCQDVQSKTHIGSDSTNMELGGAVPEHKDETGEHESTLIVTGKHAIGKDKDYKKAEIDKQLNGKPNGSSTTLKSDKLTTARKMLAQMHKSSGGKAQRGKLNEKGLTEKALATNCDVRVQHDMPNVETSLTSASNSHSLTSGSTNKTDESIEQTSTRMTCEGEGKEAMIGPTSDQVNPSRVEGNENVTEITLDEYVDAQLTQKMEKLEHLKQSSSNAKSRENNANQGRENPIEDKSLDHCYSRQEYEHIIHSFLQKRVDTEKAYRTECETVLKAVKVLARKNTPSIEELKEILQTRLRDISDKYISELQSFVRKETT